MISWQKIKDLFVQPQVPASVEKGARLRILEQESRFTIRKPQRRVAAFIWSGGMAFPKQCSIRDVSAVGACVDLGGEAAKAHALAGTITLYFPADDQEIDCQIIWRSGSRVGLKFTGSYRAPTRRYSA